MTTPDTSVDPQVTPDPAPAPDPAPNPPAPDPSEPAQGELPDDDAGLDAALNETALDLPGGDKLVDGQRAAAINQRLRTQRDKLREELTTLKPSAERAQQLEQQITTLTQQVQSLQPYVQAYQAMEQAAQQAAVGQQDPVPPADAEKWARRYQLYKPDGTLDLDTASDIIRDMRQAAREEAERVTQERVGPLQHSQIQRDSALMMARAKNTVLPSGAKADPQMVEAVWQRLDPALTATPEGARQALMMAFAYTQALTPAQTTRPRTATGQFTQPQGQEPLGDPLFTERAGGRDTPAEMPLSDKEKQYLKDVNMTEKEYLESVKSAPWMRR